MVSRDEHQAFFGVLPVSISLRKAHQGKLPAPKKLVPDQKETMEQLRALILQQKEQLKAKNDEIKVIQRDSENLRAENQLRQINLRFQRQVEQLDGKERELDEARSEIDKSRTEIDKSRTEVKVKQNKINNLLAELQQMEGKKEDLETKLKSAEESYDTQLRLAAAIAERRQPRAAIVKRERQGSEDLSATHSPPKRQRVGTATSSGVVDLTADEDDDAAPATNYSETGSSP